MSFAASGGRSGLDRQDSLDRVSEMEQAAAIFTAVNAAGAVLLMDGSKLKVRNSVQLPVAVRAELDVHWRAVAVLFIGEHCRYCGHSIDWRCNGVPFADATAAHVVCYEHVEEARQAASGRLAGPL